MRYSILLLPIVLAACVTAGSSDGRLTIETASRGQAITGANCIVATGAGNWNVLTPATVLIGSAGGDLGVVCNKDGYRPSELIVHPSAPVYSGSNMGVGVAGGNGGSAVGLGINFPIGTSGGGGYPSHVTIELTPQ